jgi:hypothetical protein
MTSTTETGSVTGTKDKDYIKDAEREGDSDLLDLFRKAQADSRKGAEQGKQLLARRLAG